MATLQRGRGTYLSTKLGEGQFDRLVDPSLTPGLKVVFYKG